MIGNRIVTKGMGRTRGKPGRAGLLTMGYGGFAEFIEEIVEGVRTVVRIGGSRAKRTLKEIREVIVWARLVSVNSKQPKKKIEGFVTVPVSYVTKVVVTMFEHVSTRVKNAYENLKITIKRIR